MENDHQAVQEYTENNMAVLSATGAVVSGAMSVGNVTTSSSASNKGVKVEYNGKQVNVYRGGNDFTVRRSDIRFDDKGFVRNTHGVSLGIDPVAMKKHGGAYKIDVLPEGLKIIQRGIRKEHYEIVPSKSMEFEEFQSLLNKVNVTEFKS